MNALIKVRSRKNVNTQVLRLLEEVNRDVDLTHEVQTEIDPNVYFNRNSVNLLVGKKASGKTYTVFREVLKLRFLKNHRYTKMLYVTNKPEDNTYTRIEELMPIPVEKVTYEDAVDAINDVVQAKSAVKKIQRGEVSMDEIDDEAKEELTEVLGDNIKSSNDVFHTIVLLDDCAFLFEKRTKSNRDLWRMLLENRQPNITYFLTQQDPKGLDTALKECLDTVWIFGGFTRRKFAYMCSSIPHDHDYEALWRQYSQLSKNQAMLFKNDIDGVKIIAILE